MELHITDTLISTEFIVKNVIIGYSPKIGEELGTAMVMTSHKLLLPILFWDGQLMQPAGKANHVHLHVLVYIITVIPGNAHSELET